MENVEWGWRWWMKCHRDQMHQAVHLHNTLGSENLWAGAIDPISKQVTEETTYLAYAIRIPSCTGDWLLSSLCPLPHPGLKDLGFPSYTQTSIVRPMRFLWDSSQIQVWALKQLKPGGVCPYISLLVILLSSAWVTWFPNLEDCDDPYLVPTSWHRHAGKTEDRKR